MSHKDRVADHRVHAVLSALEDTLRSLPMHAQSFEMSPDIERIHQVQLHASSLLNSADPNLLAIRTLDAMARAASETIQQLSLYLATGDEAQLRDAQGSSDRILQSASQIQVSLPTESLDVTRDAARTFKRSSEKLLSGLEARQSEIQRQAQLLRDQLDVSIAELNAQKGRIDAVISEYQQQFSSAESARSEQFNRALSESSGQLNNLIDKQRTRFDEIGQAAQGSFVALQAGLGIELQDIKRKGEKQADEVIERLEAMRRQAQELLQVVGNIGMTGDFQKAAISARRRLFVWQTLAVGSIAGLIGFAIAAFHSTTQETFSWAVVGTRAFVALAFGILAAFASRQADRSEAAETRNRRYQLELSSIDAYLVSLPSEMRNEVKVKLAEKLFGAIASDAGVGPARTTKFNGTGLDVIKTTVETIHELVKKNS